MDVDYMRIKLYMIYTKGWLLVALVFPPNKTEHSYIINIPGLHKKVYFFDMKIPLTF